MHRDGRDIPDGIHLPDFLEELGLRINMIRVRREEVKKIELLRRKGPLLAVHEYPPCVRVDFQSVDIENPGLLAAAVDEACVPRHMRLHTCHHLRCRKRLRHIVICTEPQATDLVDVILPRRNDDDRNILHLPDLLADLEAILPRQHQIQDDQGILSLQRLLKTGISIRRDVDLKTGNLEIIPLQLRNRLLILYNQYFLLILIHDLYLLRTPDVFT